MFLFAESETAKRWMVNICLAGFSASCLLRSCWLFLAVFGTPLCGWTAKSIPMPFVHAVLRVGPHIRAEGIRDKGYRRRREREGERDVFRYNARETVHLVANGFDEPQTRLANSLNPKFFFFLVCTRHTIGKALNSLHVLGWRIAVDVWACVCITYYIHIRNEPKRMGNYSCIGILPCESDSI